MTYYKNKYQLDVKTLFKNAYKSFTCGLALPLGELLTEVEVQYICQIINDYKE
jgi:dTDP-4-amino-4,6-dideoxygalactose transaminase